MEVNTVVTDADDLSGLLASLTSAEANETAVADQEPVEAVDDQQNADEEALLADLNSIAATAELDETLLADLETTVARAEAYESQAVTSNVEPAAKVEKPAKKARTSTPRAPRVNLNDLPNEVFQIRAGDTVDDTAKAATLSKRPTQVKVAEKFDNLFQAIGAGKKPSRYVVTAMNLLNKFGKLSSADLNAAYIAEGLGKGTASSQTGQIMHLFAAVGIADRSGQTLTACSDSIVGAKLTGIIAA